MDKIKEFFKSVTGILVTVIGVLLAALKISGMMRKNAESKLETAETDKNSSVIDSKLEKVQEQQEEQEKLVDSLEEKRDQEKRDAEALNDPKSIEDFYKKK